MAARAIPGSLPTPARALAGLSPAHSELPGQRESMSRHRVVGLTVLGLIAAALLLGCVLLFPRWLYPPLSAAELNSAKLVGMQRIDAVTDRLELQNDARTTLLQGLGGAVLLLGADFTYRQLRISREQLLHTVEASRQQLRVTQEGQITERFTRAVDQLGSESLDVQLGGIYALQQIGGSSPEERGAIYEILAAYVRVHSPWADPHDVAPVDVGAIPRLREHQPGVQAAMLALGRRAAGSGDVPLGLMGADLRRLRLSDTYIPGGRTLRTRSFGALA